jgi:hypothetical protein
MENKIKTIEAERDELIATIANERGDGKGPCGDWEYSKSGDYWYRRNGYAVVRYERELGGWDVLVRTGKLSLGGSLRSIGIISTARKGMMAADISATSTINEG